MKVLAIIVTYNRKDLLLECIQSLNNQKKVQPDILVIDNNSNDGTEMMVKKEFPDIYYENTHANLGGAGGFHYGMKKSFDLKQSYDYLWIMDDDTIPNSNVLEELLKVAKKYPDFGFLNPKIVWKDGTLCFMNRQGDEQGNLITEQTNHMTKLSRCTFVSCFLNVKAVLDVGLPIKEFFIWADDTEYTLRISRKYSCYYVSTCEVLHKMNYNLATKIENDVEERIERYFYLYRNRFYIAKHNGIGKVIRYHFSVLKTIVVILFKAKNFRFRRIKSVLKGYFAGLFFHPTVEYVHFSK